MLGTFQHSSLRIEVSASEQTLRQSLTYPEKLQQWMVPLQLSDGLPEQLSPGITFTSRLGPIAVQHTVDRVEPNGLRLLLSQGIDGFHEWSWGDGWVQSRLEGISLLPLNLGQTMNLFQLQRFLAISNS